jgi:FixJ family two-component response regulator
MSTSDEQQGEIFVVGDDPVVREALTVVLAQLGYRVTGFADGEAFLAAARTRTPACILLDVHLPGRSSLHLLRDLRAEHYMVPIFIISGQGDNSMAVEAIKYGALDFIQKPFDAEMILGRVRRAVATSHRHADHHQPRSLPSQFPGHELLTPREREVLAEIANGASNKEAGRSLGISPRTVEVHRARIMEKVGARNAADLVRIVLSANHK